MKTTIDIPDRLLAEAQALARRESTTLKALTQEALRKIIAERKTERGGFRLRDAAVDGEGLSPEFADASWDRLRTAIYEGRGE